MQSAENVNGGNGLAYQFGIDVWRYDSQPQNLDLNRFSSPAHGLEVLPTVPTQAKIQVLPGDRLFDRVVVAIELIPDRSADEVGAIRVKAFPHQQVVTSGVNFA